MNEDELQAAVDQATASGSNDGHKQGFSEGLLTGIRTASSAYLELAFYSQSVSAFRALHPDLDTSQQRALSSLEQLSGKCFNTELGDMERPLNQLRLRYKAACRNMNLAVYHPMEDTTSSSLAF